MTTFIFPGQGSQHLGMGGELFDRYAELIDHANDLLGYSVKKLCLEDSRQQLGLTEFTQPALFTVNALSYFAKCEVAAKPQYVAGHSLGEYNALLAAGVFDFLTGLRLVKKRAELMSHASGGGMVAVIGLTVEQITEVLQTENLNCIDIANYNAPLQTVLSGLLVDIQKVVGFLENAGAKMVVPLKVSAAFHSRYMHPAQQEFATFLKGVTFSLPTIPVIANVTAKPYLPNEIPPVLARQIDHSVRWTESIRYLLQLGEETFEEIGPGKVLTGLVRQIRSSK